MLLFVSVFSESVQNMVAYVMLVIVVIFVLVYSLIISEVVLSPWSDFRHSVVTVIKRQV